MAIQYCLLPCCSLLIRFSSVPAHPSNYLSTCLPLSIGTLLYCYSLQAGQTWLADLWPLETFWAKRKPWPFLPVALGVIECHCFNATCHYIIWKEDNGSMLLPSFIASTQLQLGSPRRQKQDNPKWNQLKTFPPLNISEHKDRASPVLGG